MKKFALAALAVALIGLAFTSPAASQPIRGGFYGSRVAVSVNVGRGQFFDQRRGGFYGGFDSRFEQLRRLEFQRALERQRLRSFGGLYGSQSFYLPPAASFYLPPPLLIQQSQFGYAASACGTLGLGAGYSYGALGVSSGCGAFGGLPLRGYYR